MASHSEPSRLWGTPELHDLRTFRARDLDALLGEETIFWRDSLDWNFDSSAALVRKFVDIHALNGYALTVSRRVIGYAYFVFEDHKGLIGDVYVGEEFRTQISELRLLRAVLEDLKNTADVHRIESQLMAFEGPLPDDDPHLRIFPRDFLSVRLPMNPLPARSLAGNSPISRWQEHHSEGAAQLIVAAYQGHVDSSINDQYRTVSGARKFLFNIVQFPGCGNFFPGASFVALNPGQGALAGMCLASIVGKGSGHITQICVTRECQGKGIGYELLRRSLDALQRSGVTKVSLTVTSENKQALRIYERMGFRIARRFAAYLWEGFRIK